MIFTHDTEMSLLAVAALVNSGRARSGEQLRLPTDVTDFVRDWQITGRVDGDDAELRALRALRPQLATFWTGDTGDVVDRINQLLREGRALPQLVRHDHWGYHVHATRPDAPLAQRLAVEAAMAMADVVRMDELTRFQTCSAADCDDVLVDLSKNRSRRFCDTSCANRTNVAAFRARRRVRGESG